MKLDDYALIRLHREYDISFTTILSSKFSQQYAKSFKILKKIDCLTYRLKLSSHWRIHSILSMTQLKLAVKRINSYNRFRSNHPPSIFVKKDIDIVKSYRLKKMIDKRFIKRRDTEYLIKWKEYDEKYDEWRNLSEMENAMNLIREYENLIWNTTHLSERLQKSFVAKTPSFVTSINTEMILRKFLIIISFTAPTSTSPPTTAGTSSTAMIAAHPGPSASSPKASTTPSETVIPVSLKPPPLPLQKASASPPPSPKASAPLRRSLRLLPAV